MRTRPMLLAALLLGASVPVACAAVSETNSFTSVNLPIPDGVTSGAHDVRILSSEIAFITSVRVKLDISGNFNGDLYGYLRHSSGLTVLLNRPGRTATNHYGYSDSGLNVTLADGATNDIHNYRSVVTPSAGSALTGSWQPDARYVLPAAVTDSSPRSASLSVFNGLNASGSWTLFLADVDPGGTNFLNSWTLEITGNPRLTPVLNWTNPPSIVYPAALSATELNATASVPGTFTYTPPAGTVLNAGGDQTLSVTFIPQDTTNYSTITANVSLTVLKKAMTITADNRSKTYGQTVTFAGTEFSTAGLVNGDMVTGVSLTSAGAAATATVAGTPYAIVPSNAMGTGLGNYTISYLNGVLTVNTKVATVVADAKSKDYGDANPELTAVVTGEVVGGDPINYTLDTTATQFSSVAGSPYPVTVTLGSNPNYSVTKTDRTLTVNAKVATVVADAKSKDYGDANPMLTAVVTGEVAGGDPINYTLETTATQFSSVAGSPYPITVTLGSNPNYSVTKTDGTLTVNAKAATVVAEAKAKTYGDANPVLTAMVTGEVAGGDPINYTLDTTAAQFSSVAGSPYPITVTQGSNPNYSVTKTDSTLTVNAKAATVVAEAKAKTYGDSNPVLTAVVTGEVAGGDPINYTLETTATQFSSVAGSPYPITVTQGSNPNYNVTKTDSTLTVNTKAAAVVADAKSKDYGDANPVLTAVVTGEVAGGDPINYALETTATQFSSVAGSPYPITVTLGGNPNYDVTKTDSTLTVNAKAATVVAEAKSKDYGAAKPVLTGVVTGEVAGGDTIDYTLDTTATQFSSVAGSPYPITVTLGSNPNYSVTKTDGTLTVTPAALTITAEDKSKVYGAALPGLTASYDGFVLSQGTNDLATQATLATTATSTSDVGTYPITASGASSPNYTFTYVAGTLTIGQASTAGAIASSANPAAQGANVTFTVTVNAVTPGAGTPSGTVNFHIDDSLAGSGALSSGVATFALDSLAPGTHSVVAEYAGDLNFAGVTKALTPAQFIAESIYAGPDTLERHPLQGVKARIAALLANDLSGDANAPSFDSVSATSAEGGTVSMNEGWFFYQPPSGFTNADTFTYIITNGVGLIATGTVSVVIRQDVEPSQNVSPVQTLDDGHRRVEFQGIPGRTYTIQYTEQLDPADWQPLGSGQADDTGWFEFIDTPPANAPPRIYRSTHP